MGFMLNSFTSPRSWYIYSKQLSIWSHKDRGLLADLYEGKSSYCSWAAIPTNLIMLPVPDIECWLFECLDSLLGQCVLYVQNKKYRQNHKRVSWQMYIGVYIPLGNWEHHVLESPSSHPLRSCICTDSLLWIQRRNGLLNIDFGSFGFPWCLWKMCHIIFFYLPPPLEVISSRSFFRSFLHFSISTTFRPSTSTGQHNNTAYRSCTISASISELTFHILFLF